MTFNHFDTKEKDGVRITFERVRVEDDCIDDPKDRDEGMTNKREQAYYSGEWNYIGIKARAIIIVIRMNCGTIYTLESSGLYGIESDSGEEYLNEVFESEKDSLIKYLKFIC
jgi:hypothetical protein